ncbi:MAG: hypothetical protein LBB43_01950 [Spirochaetaceae bacterium]|jgi:hypothetical protein|nr:hypothetical protein [Spirochaetaceae bacterium]
MKYNNRAVVLSLIIANIGLLYAQEQKAAVSTRNTPEKTTISGELKLVQGAIAIQKDGITYFISGLRQFIGFIEGLKEGAAVTLEGYAIPTIRQKTSVLFRATKLSIGAKDYELSSPSLGNGQMMLLWNDIPEPQLRGGQQFNYQDRKPSQQRNQHRRYSQQDQRRHQDHRQRPSIRCF